MGSIAFFDVDDTLIQGNSGFYTAVRLAQHGIIKKRRILQGIYYTLANHLFDQDVKKIYQIILNDMAGSTIDQLKPIARAVVDKDLKKRIYPEAWATLKKHHERGDIVVYLSSGPAMTLMQIREYFGIGEVVTMPPEFDGNILLNKLNLPICHGEGKVHYATETCRKYGAHLSAATFYSDSHTDIPLLEKVGHPIAVNPSVRLKKYAQKKGWPILNWKQAGK